MVHMLIMREPYLSKIRVSYFVSQIRTLATIEHMHTNACERWALAIDDTIVI